MNTNCILSGIVGVGLLLASAVTLAVCEEQTDKLKQTLPPDLVEKYKNITIERRNHYVQGLILGLLLSFGVSYQLKIENEYYNTTLFLTITLLTAVVYYTIMPKSDYMLNHLTTQEQNRAWLDVYKSMRTKYMLGFILGVLSAVPFSMVLC